MKIRLKKKEIVIFLIYYRGRGRAAGDGARVWVCDERISMGVIGMGDERRYLGVCLDGFGRREADRGHVEWSAGRNVSIFDRR